MTKQRRLSNLSFVLLALVILLCVNWLWQNDNHVDQLEYSQVRQLFLQEKVTGLTIDSGAGLCGVLRLPDAAGGLGRLYPPAPPCAV